MKKDQMQVCRHRNVRKHHYLFTAVWKYILLAAQGIELIISSSIGIYVFYDRILELIQNIYEHLPESYYNRNCFFPKILKQDIFTIMMKDNIDMNARSTFIKSHYHGTSLSIVQFPTNENPGINLENGL